MKHALAFVLACCCIGSAALAPAQEKKAPLPPVEIDFSPLPQATPQAAYSFNYNFMTVDLQSVLGAIFVDKENAREMRNYLKRRLDESGWVSYAVGDYKLVVVSYRGMPLESAEVRVAPLDGQTIRQPKTRLAHDWQKLL